MSKLSRLDCIALLEKAQELVDEVLMNIEEGSDAEMYLLNCSGDISDVINELYSE